MHVASTNQWTNNVALVAGTRLVNLQASAATYLSADLLRPQIELPGKLVRASAIYINKISMLQTTVEVDQKPKQPSKGRKYGKLIAD